MLSILTDCGHTGQQRVERVGSSVRRAILIVPNRSAQTASRWHILVPVDYRDAPMRIYLDVFKNNIQSM